MIRFLPHGFAVAACVVQSLSAQEKLGVERIAAGFERPVWAGIPKEIPQRMWVIEQDGRIWIVDLATGRRQEQPFLDIRKDVSRVGNEEGLLGLAFAPDFAKSGRFYVNFTDKDQHTRIMRFVSADRNVTDPASGEVLLRYKQDFRNHNGGWVGFGPDGMLYIGNGDGGSANDPNNRAQSMDTYLGKILRIDVSPTKGYRVPPDNPFVRRDGVLPEIWAFGVRNPWRCSFDAQTGDFWMGDVGQNHWEEINALPFRKVAGANFGWRLREGDVATPAKGVGGDAPAGAVEPVYVYRHGMGSNEGLSVTGGHVHRGNIAALKGRYVFADYQNPRIWSFRLERGKAADFKDHTSELQPEGGRINLIASFAEGPDGALYVVDHTGPVYRIIAK
jgi:glucose/arabinose dehydrogenase